MVHKCLFSVSFLDKCGWFELAELTFRMYSLLKMWDLLYIELLHLILECNIVLKFVSNWSSWLDLVNNCILFSSILADWDIQFPYELDNIILFKWHLIFKTLLYWILGKKESNLLILQALIYLEDVVSVFDAFEVHCSFNNSIRGYAFL